MNLYLWNTVFSRSAKVASLNKKMMQPNDLIDLDAHQDIIGVDVFYFLYCTRKRCLLLVCHPSLHVYTIHARQIYTESSTSRGLRPRFAMRNN